MRFPTLSNHPSRQFLPRHPLSKEGFRFPSASFRKEVSSGSETEDCFCAFSDFKQSPVTTYCRATLFQKRAFDICAVRFFIIEDFDRIGKKDNRLKTVVGEFGKAVNP